MKLKKVAKRFLVASLAVLCGLGLTAIAVPATEVHAQNSDDAVAMNRLYNPNSGEHFYTGNTTERDYLVSIGWNFEGTGWVAPEHSDTPVFRLYNANAGDHHYTTSTDERDYLVSVGWSFEGVGWYSDDNQEIPVYRQYNPNAVTGTHNYTSSKSENDWLATIGWNAEGISWYGINATVENSAPAASSSSTTSNPETYTYILNTNSKVFHKSTCSIVNRISAANRADFSGTRQELIDKGYTPCKICNP